MSDAGAIIVECRRVTKRFGTVVAVDDLDLDIGGGEIFALLGQNGAGKTTTINLLMGFVKPDAGTVRVAGIDVAADPVAGRRALAYVSEQVQLYSSLSGRENLEYFCALAGLRAEAHVLGAILEKVGLERDAHDRRAGEYSKGMRQKVGIAIALAKNARVLLLDEPTAGLDPSAAREFNALVKAAAGRGMAVLLATHDLFRAKELAQRVGIMRRGRIVTTRTAAEIAHTDLEALYLESIAEPA